MASPHEILDELVRLLEGTDALEDLPTYELTLKEPSSFPHAVSENSIDQQYPIAEETGLFKEIGSLEDLPTQELSFNEPTSISHAFHKNSIYQQYSTSVGTKVQSKKRKGLNRAGKSYQAQKIRRLVKNNYKTFQRKK